MIDEHGNPQTAADLVNALCDDAAYWRARAAQLEQALATALEQAKAPTPVQVIEVPVRERSPYVGRDDSVRPRMPIRVYGFGEQQRWWM